MSENRKKYLYFAYTIQYIYDYKTHDKHHIFMEIEKNVSNNRSETEDKEVDTEVKKGEAFLS